MISETWPAHLDAMIAAPANHKLLMENEQVRVLETRIDPGETTPVHTHCWPSTYYILSWSEFIRRDDSGNVVLDTREKKVSFDPGSAIWAGPLGPHSLENVGDKPIHIISVEVK